jgi:16S rRNA (cytosine967-C5)-methyltransferase
MSEVDQSEPARWSHPQWLIDQIRTAWPDHWQAVLQANNQRPPMTLRVNITRNSRENYLAELASMEISAFPLPFAPGAIQLKQPMDVSQLPGFGDGRVSVQDEAAQLAAELLDLHAGQHVLDVCAAPGGKTGHILETADVDLVAVDIDPLRLEKVGENLHRLRKQAVLMKGNAEHPKEWWNGQMYDRILLDAPCSATGVIRRHPDIKILRRPEDIPSLVKLQAQILEAVWPLLAPGGMLLYATCSVLPCENSEQITAFVEKQSDALKLNIDGTWGHMVKAGRQILPGDGSNCTGSNNENIAGMDGFYYACLKKQH